MVSLASGGGDLEGVPGWGGSIPNAMTLHKSDVTSGCSLLESVSGAHMQNTV